VRTLTIAMMIAVSGLTAACSAARPSVAVPAPGARPDVADVSAQEAVGAQVTLLLHVDRLQGFRFSKQLVQLGGWGVTLAGTGIDPLLDVRRAFIASYASHDGEVALVMQHTAPEDRVVRALSKL